MWHGWIRRLNCQSFTSCVQPQPASPEGVFPFFWTFPTPIHTHYVSLSLCLSVSLFLVSHTHDSNLQLSDACLLPRRKLVKSKPPQTKSSWTLQDYRALHRDIICEIRHLSTRSDVYGAFEQIIISIIYCACVFVAISQSIV